MVRYHESNHYKNYTTGQEFIEHLNVNRDSKLSKEQFVNMVGGLRDKGILIGSSREGYKIPTNYDEIKSMSSTEILLYCHYCEGSMFAGKQLC